MLGNSLDEDSLLDDGSPLDEGISLELSLLELNELEDISYFSQDTIKLRQNSNAKIKDKSRFIISMLLRLSFGQICGNLTD